MTKRFCDTEIWNKAWFQDLPIKQKLLTKFIFDNCDCAGILEISWRLLKFYFDEEITKEDFQKIKQVKFLNENTIFVEDFILFQCSIKSLTELNANNNAHKGIIKRLEKYNLLQAPNVPLTSPSLGAYSGAQEKEISSLVLSSLEKTNPDFYFSDEKEEVFNIYKDKCQNLIPLTTERRNKRILDKINAYLDEIKYDLSVYSDLCDKANSIVKIADTKIDLEMMLNCHVGIMNGKYKKIKGVSSETIKRCIEEARAKMEVESG